MKTPTNTLLVSIIILMTQMAAGQDFSVPENYTLEKKEDYAKYEKDIIRCINWLENTPISKQPKKRKATNAFLVKWLTGTPNVTIEVNPHIVNFAEKNPELLTIFMGGWTRFVLENPNHQKDLIKSNIAGLESVTKVYKLNKGEEIKKDKNVERFVSMKDNGELKSWVEKQLEK